jgi:hypothetical protein
MKQIQVRSDMKELKLIIKALENVQTDQLTQDENDAALELAARLRWRGLKFWPHDWRDDNPLPTVHETEFRRLHGNLIKGR